MESKLAESVSDNNSKVSVLFEYIYHGDVQYVSQYLSNFRKIKPRQDINESVRGNFDYTPLHYAVLWNRLEIVKEIMKIEGDPRIRILKKTHPRIVHHGWVEEAGIEPIYLAEKFGKIRISKILRPYTDDYSVLQEFFRMGKLIACGRWRKTFFQYSVHTHLLREKVRILMMIGKRLDLPVEMWTEILSFWRIHDIVYGLP